MFSFDHADISNVIVSMKTNFVFIVIAFIAATPCVSSFLKKHIKEDSTAAVVLQTVYCTAAIVLCTALLVNSSYNPFLYFRF